MALPSAEPPKAPSQAPKGEVQRTRPAVEGSFRAIAVVENGKETDLTDMRIGKRGTAQRFYLHLEGNTIRFSGESIKPSDSPPTRCMAGIQTEVVWSDHQFDIPATLTALGQYNYLLEDMPEKGEFQERQQDCEVSLQAGRYRVTPTDTGLTLETQDGKSLVFVSCGAEPSFREAVKELRKAAQQEVFAAC